MGNVGRKQIIITPENVAIVSGIIKINPRKFVRKIVVECDLKH